MPYSHGYLINTSQYLEPGKFFDDQRQRGRGDATCVKRSSLIAGAAARFASFRRQGFSLFKKTNETLNASTLLKQKERALGEETTATTQFSGRHECTHDRAEKHGQRQRPGTAFPTQSSNDQNG